MKQRNQFEQETDLCVTFAMLFAIGFLILMLSGCGTFYHVSATGKPTFIHTGDADYMEARLADGTVLKQHNPRNSQALTNGLKLWGTTKLVSEGINTAGDLGTDAIKKIE